LRRRTREAPICQADDDNSGTNSQLQLFDFAFSLEAIGKSQDPLQHLIEDE
jgi:hypothetical protein